MGRSFQDCLVKDDVTKNDSTVEPPIKDTLKEDKPPYKGWCKCTLEYTLYITTSERGQPLNGQNGWSQTCPLFRGSTGITLVFTYILLSNNKL